MRLAAGPSAHATPTDIPTAELAGCILGLDIGGTKTAVLVGTEAGQVLDRREFPSRPADGFDAMWDSMIAEADVLVAAHRGRIASIGVSIGGPVDSRQGVVLSPPNLPGWDRVPLRDLLQQRYGFPAFIEHDAKAGALAEWLHGAAQGYANAVFLTLGTGLGAGLILDGRLYRGTLNTAGEVGHWRLADDGPKAYDKAGSWEALCSGSGLPRLARHMFPEHPWRIDMTAADICTWARTGDQRCLSVVTASATWLGRGIALLVDLLNPEIVVLGSLAVRAGDLILPVVQDVLGRECLERTRGCVVVASALGERLGDVAALSAATYGSTQ